MADVFMKKTASPRSPRVRAHPLKMKSQTMKSGMSKKALSKKKIRSQYFYPPPEDLEDDLMHSVVDDPDEIGTYRSMNDGSIHSNYSMGRSMGQMMKSMVGEDISKLQARLTRALEDSDMLRSRLRMELQEKQALEMKVTELTDKLVEAKKGLQETSLALHKVQMATNQLMSKRDQRELQLQSAIDQNHLYEKKISELEIHIAHMAEISDAKSGAHSHSEKLINEQLEKIHQLEEESGMLKGQISTLRRENMRLTDEKADLEYMLETKKKRIGLLEEHIKTTESQELGTPSQRINTANGGLRASIGSMPSMDGIDFEAMQKKMNELSSLEHRLAAASGDKKMLEDRLKQFEMTMINQQEVYQKQLQQQQAFYQQQLQQQQQQMQQLQMQSFSSNIPVNGISLPLDQIQQLANAAAANGQGGGGGPIVIRAVSRGSMMNNNNNNGERPRSQQRSTNTNSNGNTNGDLGATERGGGERERERERGNNVTFKQPTPPQSSSAFAENNSSANSNRPRSNGPRPGIDTPNAATVSIPVRLPSRENQGRATPASRPQPAAAPVQQPIESSAYQSLGNGTSQKPSSANNGEVPVPQKSAAELNAMDGQSERQPSRQQQLMSRVSSATGSNAEEVKKRLMDERKDMKKAILVWNKQFVEENKREPSKAEREQGVGNFYRKYRQTTRILKEMGGESTKGGDKDEDL